MKLLISVRSHAVRVRDNRGVKMALDYRAGRNHMFKVMYERIEKRKGRDNAKKKE
jgi:hypothetical protein